jgi:hypothetical protein
MELLGDGQRIFLQVMVRFLFQSTFEKDHQHQDLGMIVREILYALA